MILISASMDVNCTILSAVRHLIFSGYPSAPLNLTSTQISTPTDSFTVRLDWDPPQIDGGVPITDYLISVNGSQEMGRNSTNVTLTLNSTGQYVIGISAVNECGLLNITSTVVSGRDVMTVHRKTFQVYSLSQHLWKFSCNVNCTAKCNLNLLIQWNP